MKVENILAKNISSAGEKASYDAACKRLLANKVILAWIMKSCIEEYRDCEIQEIVENYIEGEADVADVPVNIDEQVSEEQIQNGATEDASIYEGVVTYDIRFCAKAPVSKEKIRLIINIEAQNDFYPGYPIISRGIYYCSRLISSQYGVEFSDAHYEKIKKVYSIWICMNPPKYRENSINRYSITEEQLIGSCSERKENYEFFLGFQNPTISITSEVECSGAKTRAKAAGESFFLHYLYAVLRAVNEIKEFRFRIDSEGRVVYFDTVDMLTPIKVADNGRFFTVRLPWYPDFKTFYAEAKAIISGIDPDKDPYEAEKTGGSDLLDVVLLSATPDLYFISNIGPST